MMNPLCISRAADLFSMIPPLAEIQLGSSSALADALEILFEHSPVLINTLQPQLRDILKASPPLESYTQLINYAIAQIISWDVSAQSQFISGHPRIGESKNLSKLSAKEQGSGGVVPTSPEVLARLSHLNACYEIRYPGLRYITFVNGRTRLEIAEEMEDMLCLAHSLSPDNPPFDTIYPVDNASEEWKRELDRAVLDIGLIAKSRLRALGVI
jgi:2-oxo-4-hydroxy-4-carboxy--5-ureidoimidazoline (OHCU) decarboxylase